MHIVSCLLLPHLRPDRSWDEVWLSIAGGHALDRFDSFLLVWLLDEKFQVWPDQFVLKVEFVDQPADRFLQWFIFQVDGMLFFQAGGNAHISLSFLRAFVGFGNNELVIIFENFFFSAIEGVVG